MSRPLTRVAAEPWPATESAALRAELERHADPERAVQAARYMKDRFEFLGIPMAIVRAAGRPLVRGGRAATTNELLDAADALWAQPEREFQYVGVDLLRRWTDELEPDSLVRIEQLIRTKSWWDTVDLLAGHVVGGMISNHPELVAVMDDWIDSDDMWIARAALLHQLHDGEATDGQRLFRHVERRADDTEFFIRKACGWALRQYARVAPDDVRSFVEAHGLSPLTRREALKHL